MDDDEDEDGCWWWWWWWRLIIPKEMFISCWCSLMLPPLLAMDDGSEDDDRDRPVDRSIDHCNKEISKQWLLVLRPQAHADTAWTRAAYVRIYPRAGRAERPRNTV